MCYKDHFFTQQHVAFDDYFSPETSDRQRDRKAGGNPTQLHQASLPRRRAGFRAGAHAGGIYRLRLDLPSRRRWPGTR